MTGAYLRAIRNGKWDNVEVEHLTEEELKDKFSHRSPEELVNWMSMLCKYIRQNETLFKELEQEGILKSVPAETVLEQTDDTASTGS